MLDELPFGSFIEIEGEAAGIRQIANQLHLNWETAIPASYHALFEQLAATAKLPFRDLTFANFNGLSHGVEVLGVQAADSQFSH